MPCSALPPRSFGLEKQGAGGGLTSHASTFSGPDPRTLCPAALGVGGIDSRCSPTLVPDPRRKNRLPFRALKPKKLPKERCNRHTSKSTPMQLSYASGMPCVSTCDKPCFQPSSSEAQRLPAPASPSSSLPLPRSGPQPPGPEPSREQPWQRNLDQLAYPWDWNLSAS